MRTCNLQRLSSKTIQNAHFAFLLNRRVPHCWAPNSFLPHSVGELLHRKHRWRSVLHEQKRHCTLPHRQIPGQITLSPQQCTPPSPQIPHHTTPFSVLKAFQRALPIGIITIYLQHIYSLFVTIQPPSAAMIF